MLVIRAGDHSLQQKWFDAKSARNFDLLVSYYGTREGRFPDDGEFHHVMTGPPWPAYHAIMRDNPQLRERYDYVGFADDDLDAAMTSWNALFAFCHRQGFDLAQPSILGPMSCPIAAPVPGLCYRLTHFVEIACPIFSRRALAVCYPSFGESVSGWGIDHIWPRRSAKQGGKLAVIDAISVTRTDALRSGTLYEYLQGRGIDPAAESRAHGPDSRKFFAQLFFKKAAACFSPTPAPP